MLPPVVNDFGLRAVYMVLLKVFVVGCCEDYATAGLAETFSGGEELFKLFVVKMFNNFDRNNGIKVLFVVNEFVDRLSTFEMWE